MTRILELIISAVIVALLFLAIGLFLPDHARVERKIELSNPTTQVYDFLNHFKRYNQWQPWASIDPRAQYTLEGPEYGVGAKINWKSWNKVIGEGSLTIDESEPEALLRMGLDNNWRGSDKTFTFTIDQNVQTNAVTLVWALDVDYGWDILGRYAGLYLNGRVGELMNDGLAKIASIMATVPNVDYSQVEVSLVDVQQTDFVFVGLGVPAAPRLWGEAEVKMDDAWNEIATFISKNKLEALGPKRRIINVLGEENNDVNVGFPIAPPPPELVTTGNVRLGKTYFGRALTTQYRGHRVGLAKPRDMLRAYALTHGLDFDRDMIGSWEEWLPDEELTGQPMTNLVLPIK